MLVSVISLSTAAVALVAIVIFGSSADSIGSALHELSAYLAAAVRRNFPLGQALRAYSSELPGFHGLKRRDVLNRVADLVDSGMTFSSALDAQPEVFPTHYRALVRAGERGGNLGNVLSRLAEAAEAESFVARRAVGFAVYPLAVSGIALLQFVLIGSVVAPRFVEMFREMGLGDDGLTRELELMLHLPVLGLALFIIVAAMVAVALPLPTVRSRIGHYFHTLASVTSWLRWHMSFLSRYERRRAVSRYALAAGALLDAGVPTREALGIAATASGNRHFDRIALVAAEEVGEGRQISEAMRAADLRSELPPDFLWYIEIGESSGKLPDAFTRAAESSSLRSRSALGSLVKLIFPASIVLLGLFVGTLAYAFFHALYGIMQGLGI